MTCCLLEVPTAQDVVGLPRDCLDNKSRDTISAAILSSRHEAEMTSSSRMRRAVNVPNMATIVSVCRLLLLLPVFLPRYDVISGSVSAGESVVTWSGCPPTFAVADNLSKTSSRCECTTFREMHCHNLLAVPPFHHPPSITWRGVYMSRQGISELNSGAFDNLRTTKLVLNFNRLGDEVKAGALAGQETSLVELQLAGCGITSLPKHLLVGMDALTRLHLWGNRLRELPHR